MEPSSTAPPVAGAKRTIFWMPALPRIVKAISGGSAIWFAAMVTLCGRVVNLWTGFRVSDQPCALKISGVALPTPI